MLTGLGGRIAKSWMGQTESYDGQVLVCVCQTYAFVQVGFWGCLERASHSVQSSIADTCEEQCAVFAEWPFSEVPADLWSAWP